MQRNPFIEELIAEELQRSPVDSCPSSGSSPFNYAPLPSKSLTLSRVYNTGSPNVASIARERPRPVARQISLPAMLPRAATHSSSKDCPPRSMSETDDWEDTFDAFASIRFNSPKGHLLEREQKLSLNSCYGQRCPTAPRLCKEDPPPLPPRRVARTPGNDVFSDGWLHRGQELAVHKEAYLLSQTGVASLQHGREAERNNIAWGSRTKNKASDSQPYANMNSAGVLSEETFKKFKYEPLEDEADCWGGMLFEQDLYGRVCRGNFKQPTANLNLSLNAENRPTSKLTPTNPGPNFFLDKQLSVADLLNLPVTPSKPNVTITQADDRKSSSPEAMCVHDASLPPTPGDLHLNAKTADFGFIDSDGSSQSEAVDTLQSIESLSVTLPKLSDDPRVSSYHAETPQGIFTLKDTYIPETNSSFEITSSSNKLAPVFPDNSQNCPLESDDGTLHLNSRQKDILNTQTLTPVCLESGGILKRPDDFNNTRRATEKEFDDNGNPQGKISTFNQSGSLSVVVSARLRPKGVRSNTNSPSNQAKSGEREFEQLLSLVQNISGASEGPLSYQPTKSALYNLMISNNPTDLHESSLHKNQPPCDESNVKADLSSPDNPLPFISEKSRLVPSSVITFEDLHAKVAPNFKPASKMEPYFRVPEPSSCAITSALPESAGAHASQQTTLPCYPSINHSSAGPSDGVSTTLAVAPCTSSTSTTSNTDLPPPVDAQNSLLPEKTQPASNLPHQESR